MVIHKSAVFSPCRTWRYILSRVWDFTRPLAMFIGLNCSTADETQDDPTVRRCVGYARDWGYGGLLMTNLFAFRATDPRVMKAAPDPVGPDNDFVLKTMALKGDTGIVVAAWGNHGAFRQHGEWVVDMLNLNGVVLHCLRVTKSGEPMHPLYLPRNMKPIRYDKAFDDMANNGSPR